jgi:hypothetical protein
MTRGLGLALGIALGVLGAAPMSAPGLLAAPHPQGDGCPGNRLLNSGFEEAFLVPGRADEVVASGWSAWYETYPGVRGLNYAPRYQALRLDRDGPDRVQAGMWAQGVATENATHVGGLYQKVEVPPKSQVLARAVVRAWSSDGEDARTSDPPGLYVASLGIDPLGGSNANSARLLWTRPVTVTDAWTPLVLDVPVEGPTVTLFLRGIAVRILAHHEARWDSACLAVIGAAGEPTPSPTPRPRPSNTSDPDAPTATVLPGTREAMAAARLRELLGTVTAGAIDGEPAPADARPTGRPTPTATPPPELGGGLTSNVGLVFLGIGALLGGLLLSGGRRVGRPRRGP